MEALQQELAVVSEPPEGYTWVVDIATEIGVSKRSASHVAQKLREEGIHEIRVRQEGRHRVYFKDA